MPTAFSAKSWTRPRRPDDASDAPHGADLRARVPAGAVRGDLQRGALAVHLQLRRLGADRARERLGAGTWQPRAHGRGADTSAFADRRARHSDRGTERTPAASQHAA